MTALRQIKTMTSEIAVAGEAAALDLSGAMYLSGHDALVVADLHFEKGSSFARRGSLLPPYDTRETMAALALAVERYAPRTVIALGDSFHDLDGPDRLLDDDRALPPSIGGEVVEELTLGNLVLRHEPAAAPAGTSASKASGAPPAVPVRELAGHLHPVGKVVMRGRGVRRRCFVTDGERCLLPALGAYAGGLNACDPAIRSLFPKGFTAHLIGEGRLFAIGQAMLCRD